MARTILLIRFREKERARMQRTGVLGVGGEEEVRRSQREERKASCHIPEFRRRGCLKGETASSGDSSEPQNTRRNK